MKEKTEIKDKKVTGASYIQLFYNNVCDLNSHFSQYVNLQTELMHKGLLSNPTDESRNALDIALQTVRYTVMQCYISYESICSVQDIKDSDNLEETYKKIKTDYIINEKPLEHFTICMNKFLLKDIFKELLYNSQEVLDGIYNTD